MATPNISSLIQPAPAVAQPGQPAAPAAQPAQPDSQTAAGDSGAPGDGASDSDDDDSIGDAGGDTPVKVQREFSAVNHALVDLADNLGLRRAFTIPYVEQDMNE